MTRLLFAALTAMLASPAFAAGTWLVMPQEGGAIGYDASSLSTDAEGHKRIAAGLYSREPVDLGGKMASFIVEDAKIDCAADKVFVTAYQAFDDNATPLGSAPGGAWRATGDEPLLALLKPVACEGKALEGARSAEDRDAALRMMKSMGAAALPPEAGRLATALAKHLNAHGRHFVTSEAGRLAIGDASESGAKDDVRDACPNPLSCLDLGKLSPEELMSVMLLLAEQRAAERLDQQLRQRVEAMQERNATLKRLMSELEKATGDSERARLKSEIDRLNGEAQTQMIQIQDLTNKRNEAFDTLSKFLQQYQKTLDSIVHNMR